MFGTVGSTTRLITAPLPLAPHHHKANMPQAPARGLGRRPSDLALNMGQMNSPSMGRLKSPTLSQVHSPLGTSPSANLKSPQTPSAMASLPAASAAPSGPLKSPQVLSSVLSVCSPTSSPGHLKSPPIAASSPGWVPSPKNALSSPGIGQSKPAIGLSNSAPLGSLEQDPPPSQNPLSLMMSQMSKYAMPSSTPLYHNAIKTIATSDDEMMPDRPMLPPGVMPGVGSGQPGQLHVNSVGVPPAQSPMAVGLPGQQPLSHEPPTPNMSSPSPLGSNMPMHSSAPPQGPVMLPPGAQDSLNQPCGPPGQLVFPTRLQQPPTNGGGLPGPGGPGVPQQHYAPGMGLPPEELPLPQPSSMVPPQRLPGRLPEPYPPVLPGVFRSLNASGVERRYPAHFHRCILKFRILSSRHPAGVAPAARRCAFPRLRARPSKVQPPSNLHLMNLQNMMVEQAPARAGPQGMPRSMAMCQPGQVPLLGRTGLAPQQAMMGNSLPQGLLLPQQNLQMAQQNFLLMQAKQRSMSVSGEMYAPPGHLLSPQGSLVGPPPQQNLMASHPMRQRSVSLDGQMAYGPGTGSMANLPF
uniref:Uncharacterized protein n=1 Tax=Sphaerodactylus townsendi TaxID=933632 RepID=A0ACB8EZA0_9SAUR